MSSRLQKRCLITSFLAHAGLALLLVLAPAFRDPDSRLSDGGPPLEMIPGELVDAALAPGFIPQASAPEASPPAVQRPREPEPEPEPEPAPKAPPRTPQRNLDFDVPKAKEPGFTLPSARLEEKKKPKVEEPKPRERESVKLDLTKIKTLKPKSTPPKPAPTEPTGPSAEELARQRRQDLARSLEGASGRIAGAVSQGAVQVQIGPAGGGGEGAEAPDPEEAPPTRGTSATRSTTPGSHPRISRTISRPPTSRWSSARMAASPGPAS